MGCGAAALTERPSSISHGVAVVKTSGMKRTFCVRAIRSIDACQIEVRHRKSAVGVASVSGIGTMMVRHWASHFRKRNGDPVLPMATQEPLGEVVTKRTKSNFVERIRPPPLARLPAGVKWLALAAGCSS